MQALACKDNEMNVLTAGQRSLCAILALTLTMSGSVIVLAQATPRGRGGDNPPARQSEPQTRGGDRSPGRTSEPPAAPQSRDRGSEPSQPQRSSGGDARPSDVPTRGGDRSPVRTSEPPSAPARERGPEPTSHSRSSGGDSRPVRDTGRSGDPTPIVRGDRSPDRTSGPAVPPQRDNGSNSGRTDRGDRTDRADRPVTTEQRRDLTVTRLHSPSVHKPAATLTVEGLRFQPAGLTGMNVRGRHALPSLTAQEHHAPLIAGLIRSSVSAAGRNHRMHAALPGAGMVNVVEMVLFCGQR